MFLQKKWAKSTKIVGFYSMLLCVALSIAFFSAFAPPKKKKTSVFFRFRDWPEHDHKIVKLIRKSKTSKKTTGQLWWLSGGTVTVGLPNLDVKFAYFSTLWPVRVSDFPVQRSRKRSLAVAVNSQRKGAQMSFVSYISLTPPPCGIVLEN